MNAPAPLPSRVVVTMGLHGSASTWAFNVVRELMIAAFGADAVVSFFADSPATLRAEAVIGRHAVCKTRGWANLEVFARRTFATVVVTVRDPRDCVFSLIERFGMTPAPAVQAIEDDCRYAAACIEAGHLVLRYEQRFFDDPRTVDRLASHLGVAVRPETTTVIFDRYRTEAVRAFAVAVPSLPADRLSGGGNPTLYDRVTHIHRTHIGDGRVGKWRERLDEHQRAELTGRFEPFLARLGYSTK
jgi:hypothetical protein